ncbi:ribokinase [Lederbergia citrea]|uniref:ribokinase n=1 Tax=Lederbergia citrea TaxID=2833581 RepID=UPI003211B409
MIQLITVVGSMNMDIVVETNKLPEKGETILGKEFNTFPGGKGANQAVAAARLGGEVQMIASVGNDVFGKELTENLSHENIDITHVSISSEKPTGIANIILSENDNRIIVIPGANNDLSTEHIQQLKETIQLSKVVIVQLEILPETVRSVLEICKEFNVPVVFDPAPAQYFDPTFIPYIKYMTPNEHECEQLFGLNMEAALEKYPNQLIVTLGKDGVRYFDGKEHIKIAGINTNVVDTTGAGDTFNGALGYALSEKYELKDAIMFANAASSLSVEKLGAQAGMPSKEDVEKRLSEIYQ